MTAPVITGRPAPAGTPRPSHPRSEYWDVFSASWRTRGPVVPAPRTGS